MYSRAFASVLGLAVVLGLSSARAEISDDVIRVGVLNDVDGLYADPAGQGSQVAAELALEDFGGKVAGRRVEIALGDHNNKAEDAAAKAKEWVAQGFDVIVDMPSSAAAIAVQQVTKDSGVVTIVTGAASEALTGKFCSPTGINWQMSTSALAIGVGEAVAQTKPDLKWYLITVDHAFGRDIQAKIAKAIEPYGGSIVGTSFHPWDERQYFGMIQKGLDSGADVIAFASAGKPVIDAIRQAKEMGVVEKGRQMVNVLTLLDDMRAIGLYSAAGTRAMVPYYWDQSERSRAFAKRFRQRMGNVPSSDQIAVYTGLLHYFKAVEKSGADRGAAVVKAMKAMPVDDGITLNGKIRKDGRMVHDISLMEVKSAAESRYFMDYYKQVTVVPGEKAFDPQTSDCPYLAQM